MLNTLRRIVQEVSTAEDIRDALDIVVASVCDVVNTEACSIYLLDSNSEYYHLMASVGFQGCCGRDSIKIRFNEGLVGLVGQREEPINVEQASAHPNYHYFPETGEERFQAFLGAPIIHQKRLLGVLVTQQVENRRFDEGEEAFLVTVCAQLAAVIAHAEATGELTVGPFPQDGEQEEVTVMGIPCAPGVVIGQAVVIYPYADIDAVPNRKTDDIESELNDFQVALDAVRQELQQLAKRMHSRIPKEEAAIFEAYSHMLHDTSIGGEVNALIQQGEWAQSALKKVIKKHVRIFEEMDDEYLRERALDVKDLGRRVLSRLQANDRQTQYSEKTVLVGDEITAARLAEVPEGLLAGIVSGKGSSNSHVAILARSMGLPVIMGVEGLNLQAIDGKEVIVDGYNGRVYISPTLALRREFQRLISEEEELYQGLKALQDKPAITPDGYAIELMVNTGLLADAASALQVGADGVGLYRTEIPFLIRDRFPTELEQFTLYRSIMTAYHGKPVVMRTLDIGGDKNLPYFPIEEVNPFLGWRGIRVTLDHPELFLVQIRAMLRASENLNNLKILLPMITNLSEIKEAKYYIKQAYQELIEENIQVVMPEVGAMIEVPSAVYQAHSFADICDFISIGTNDLTQYLLAVDRNNSRVANLYESLHPAILQALMSIAKAMKNAQTPFSVCGEMAGDPVASILLMAMGVNSLSMNPTSVGPVKWIMRTIPQSKARQLLHDCLSMDNAQMIRRHVEKTLDQAGLGGLIRAGK